MNKRLGVDIGGVIVDRHPELSGDDFFQVNYLEVPALAGAFDALAYLTTLFEGEVFLVSSCTEIVEKNTLDWFRYHNFFAHTGIKSENVRFCRERPLKFPICKELGITHFIDDRIGVLRLLTTVRKLYHFKPDPSRPMKTSFDTNVEILPSWSDVRSVFPSI